MPGVVGGLGEERPLGAAVALAERVQGAGVGEDPARAVMNGSRAGPAAGLRRLAGRTPPAA
jgi:hypothetical protein